MVLDASGGQTLLPNLSPSAEQVAEEADVPKVMMLQQGTHLTGAHLGTSELNASDTRHETVMKQSPEAKVREAAEPKKSPIAAEAAQLQINTVVHDGSQSSAEATFWYVVELLQHSPSSVLSRAWQAAFSTQGEAREHPQAEKKQEAILLQSGSASAQQGQGSPSAWATAEEELSLLDRVLLAPGHFFCKEIALQITLFVMLYAFIIGTFALAPKK